MKTYLSYGGGVNSTACIVLHAQGKLHYDEAIYVDHGCDWPETREYVRMMADRFPITIIETPETLYDYAWKYQMVPYMRTRWCTRLFKTEVIERHVEPPCFQLIGFSSDEAHRAQLSSKKDIEFRYPLIEHEIDREGCKQLIVGFGLPVPIKSGCYFCPMQRISQWKKMRRTHPGLFCKTEQLEKRNMEHRESQGKKPMYIYSNKKSLREVVKEKAEFLFEEMQYPPCECEL